MGEVLVAKVVERGRGRLGDLVEVVGEVEHEIVTLGNLENRLRPAAKWQFQLLELGVREGERYRNT